MPKKKKRRSYGGRRPHNQGTSRVGTRHLSVNGVATRKRHNQSPTVGEGLSYKDTFFFQVTACGILTLGILVLVMLSPNSYAIRHQIVHTIHTADVWSLALLIAPDTDRASEEVSVTEDFRIDEQLLEDVAFRRNEAATEPEAGVARD